jgi:hypothetical protein
VDFSFKNSSIKCINIQTLRVAQIADLSKIAGLKGELSLQKNRFKAKLP